MVRSGFWNSLGTDVRTYYNTDFSHLMSLMIKDGIHQNYGEHLVVLPGTGLQVIVQTGECWFNECWVRNDADLQISIDNAPIVAGYKRIDAIAIKIDATNAVRNGTIEYVAGTPGSNPVAPTLTDTDEIHWHLLALVTVNANATSISASNIENKVGTTGTPFITGILETVDITTLLGQWSSQFNDWMDENNTEFQAWFQHMKDQLDEDAAAHLQNEIDGITDDIETINDRIDNLDLSASSISYVDTTTQLGASNVQTAIEKLKAAFSSALTSLKATPIAQVVGATGNTFAAVIQKLNAIVVRQNNPTTKWQNSSGRPVTNVSNGGARGNCADNTIRSVFEVPTGYYQNGRDLLGVTDAHMNQLGWLIPSGNKAITANGSNIDVRANATVSVNVPQTAFKRSYHLSTPSQGVLHLKVTRIYPWGSQVTYDGNVDVVNNTYDDGYFRLSRLANNRWYYIFRVIRQVDGTDSFLEIPEQLLWYVNNVGYATTYTIPTRD